MTSRFGGMPFYKYISPTMVHGSVFCFEESDNADSQICIRDCGFLSSKSQWGELRGSPAGLLRLTLNFHEPADFKLSSAEVHLCFLPSDAGSSPNITEHLYPDILCGPPLSQQKSRKTDVEPTVEAMGASVGVGGIHSSAEWSQTLRWLLRGSRLPDEQNLYTKAEW